MAETADGGWLLDCSASLRYGEPLDEPKIILTFGQGNFPGDPHWLVGGRKSPSEPPEE